MMKARIALIIPYFGDLPHWFPYFVRSVAHSPILDVLLFTDAQAGPELPDNIKVHYCSLARFSELASRILSLPISLSHPFKICDFRPAFGQIFQECIRHYEFWAFGDIDLVYGDVAAFLEPLMEHHDVISCRKEWVSGSLCVLRNSKEINSLFALSADWKRAFLSPDSQLFDEMGGFFYSDVLKGADVLSLKGKVESFTHVLKRLVRSGDLRCAFEDLACEQLDWGETIVHDSGHLTRFSDGIEVMYVHYVCMKRRFFEVPVVAAAPERFLIRKTGIYLERPGTRILLSQEAGRVIRGGMHGATRLLSRWIG